MFVRMTLVLVVILVATAAMANAPRTISYQGRITDISGNPVPDGVQTVTFRLFDVPVGGGVLWTEPSVAIGTVNGLFTATLGSPTPFPTSVPISGEEMIFTDVRDLWLEVEVNGQIQAPRTQLHSAPYAIAAGDLSGRGSNVSDVGIKTYSGYAMLNTYGWDGEEKIRLWGPSFGEVLLYDGGPTFGITSELTAALSASLNSGGALVLNDSVGNFGIRLDGGENGDESVELPFDAVNMYEVFSEPGIAIGRTGGGATLLPTSVVSSYNIVSVTISIPAPGFIVLDGSLYYSVEATGSGYCFGWAQISEISGSGQVSGYYQWIGSNSYGNTSEYNNMWASANLKRTYWSSTAGTFTYYLQGAEYDVNVPSAQVWVGDPSVLVATYYPTAYGGIAQVSTKPPTDNPEYSSSQTTDPITKTTATVYTEDLRYYEMQAQKAYIQNLEAQAALTKARLEASAKRQRQVDADVKSGQE